LLKKFSNPVQLLIKELPMYLLLIVKTLQKILKIKKVITL